jgi:hypothetical protein
MKRIALFAGLALALLTGTAGAQVKISALPAGTTLAGTEALPLVQSGVTVQSTPAAFGTYILGAPNSGSLLIGAGAGVAPTTDTALTWTTGTQTLTMGTTSVAAVIQPTQPTGAATGVSLTVKAGQGGTTNGGGGNITVSGGDQAAGTAGNGGAATVQGGSALGTGNRAGGAATLKGGNGSGSSAGGAGGISGGNGGATGNGGPANMNGGAGGSTSGNGGSINASGGNATTSGNGGSVTFTGGIAAGTTKNGGTLAFNAGQPTSGGTSLITFSTKNFDGSINNAGQFDSTGKFITFQAVADQSYSRQTPTTGFAITIGNQNARLVLHPAGTLATGTVTMPAAPIDGQLVEVMSDQAVTTLTVSANAGQTIANPPTTLAAGTGFGYLYCAADTEWYRRF